MNFYDILNVFIKVIHILLWGSTLVLLIKEIIETRESEKVRELLKDTDMTLFLESLSVSVMENTLKGMEDDIRDDRMRYYHSELSKEVWGLKLGLKVTLKQLDDYLE